MSARGRPRGECRSAPHEGTPASAAAMTVRACTLVLLAGAALLSGCLEVDQHPRWMDGHYRGKADARTPDARFHGDRMAWHAAVADRTTLQDEFTRVGP